MRIVGILSLAMLLAGCDFFYKSEIESCHDRVHGKAKYQAEIISTEVRDKGYTYGEFESNKVIIEGQAKLQNGYGAWSNYSYSCSVLESGMISKFRFEEGYKAF